MFIKVTGEDGVFYDSVIDEMADEHLRRLRDGGYEAEVVSAGDVPPCIYRDYISTGRLETYREVSWMNGKDFYLDPATQK